MLLTQNTTKLIAIKAINTPARGENGTEIVQQAVSTSVQTKRFGGITATNNVMLNLRRGARHALIGPNGAG